MKVTEIQFPKRIEALPRVAAYARVSSGKDAMQEYQQILTSNSLPTKPIPL